MSEIAKYPHYSFWFVFIHIISIWFPYLSFPFSNIQLQTHFAPWLLRAGPPAKSPPPIPGGIGCLSQQKTGVFTLGTKKTKSRMKPGLMIAGIAGQINGINGIRCFSSVTHLCIHGAARRHDPHVAWDHISLASARVKSAGIINVTKGHLISTSNMQNVFRLSILALEA